MNARETVETMLVQNRHSNAIIEVMIWANMTNLNVCGLLECTKNVKWTNRSRLSINLCMNARAYRANVISKAASEASLLSYRIHHILFNMDLPSYNMKFIRMVNR